MSVPCSGPYCVLADWLSGFPRQGGTAGWAPSARAWQGQAASAGPTTWRYRPGLSWTPTGQALPLGLHVCQRRAPGRPCALRTNAHLVAGGGHPHLAADALRSTGVLLDIRKGKPHLELPRPGLSLTTWFRAPFPSTALAAPLTCLCPFQGRSLGVLPFPK